MEKIIVLLLCIILAGGCALAEETVPDWLTQGITAAEAGDYAKALENFLVGAEQGDARARYNLGVMYDNGLGVELSHEKAAEYYRLAADQGHGGAQFNLGICYNLGEGVEQSTEKALPYLSVRS